jgi:hypothetical protein
VPSLDPAIPLFGEEIAPELNRIIDGQPLEQKFETQIKRRLRCLNLERLCRQFVSKIQLPQPMAMTSQSIAITSFSRPQT